MHDAWTLLASDAAQIWRPVEQRIDEGASRMTGSRVHDHAGRLVHYEEVGVLVDDLDRERLSEQSSRCWWRDRDRHDLASPHGRARTPDFRANPYQPLPDQPLNLTA